MNTNLVLARQRREIAQAVMDNEERLRGLFEQAPGFMCVLHGPDHVFELANRSFLQIAGPRKVLGRPLREAFPELEGQGFLELLDRVYQTGVAVTGRGMRAWLQHAPDDPGKEVFVDFVYQPIKDQSGAVTGIFVEGSEVTERIRAEAAVLAQKAQFEAVLDTVPAAVWFTHDPDARSITGNRAAAALLRLPQSANFSLTAGPEERPRHFRVYRDGVELSPEQLPLQRAARGEPVPTEEEEVVFQDGTSVMILAQAVPLRDRAGGLIGAVCTAIDITDRKRAEAALRRSEEEFRTFGENLPNLCWMADANGWIYWYNKRWFEYTGTTLDQMRGWGWTSVHDPALLPRVTERWEAALRSGTLFEMTFPLRGADGAFRPFLTRIVPIRDANGAIIRWFGSNVDISAQQETEAALRASEEALRRLNEQLEARVAQEVAAREQAQARLAQAQRMEALGQLAGGIAHDFNNVLQAVTGGLSLIQKRADDPQAVRQFARMVIEAAGRGAAITSRLLAFARKGELRAVPVPPRALLESLREILAPTLGAAITVLIEAEPDMPPLLADKAQLETVLVNLAVNARDAMQSGGTLTLSARSEMITGGHRQDGLKPGAYVRLDVTDTGIGMDSATLSRASEPFFTTKPSGKGTGLGLAMARGFAQQSDGGFSIRSAPGEGTTVTLWFPRAEQAVLEGRPNQAPLAIQLASERFRVLVVDDDPMVRQVLARQMESAGYKVVQAADGLSALAQLDAGQTVDLLVTDFSMPGMNGLLLIEGARRRFPDLPALLLTGYADATLHEIERVGDGRTIIMRKPVPEEVLAEQAALLLRPQGMSLDITAQSAAARPR